MFLLVCCYACESGVASVGSTAGESHRIDPLPFRDDWRLVIDQPFPLTDGTIEIGGTEHADNFANRGDVTVLFADTDRITVEMRRFTMAPNEDIAEEDFDALEVWAYDASGSPSPPDRMSDEDNCRDPDRVAPWRDGCQIRVYYEGLSQLARSGADLRVTLPRYFLGDVEITADDNDADPDYHNRGNVCLQGLPGSADVLLGSGSAYVTLAEDVTEIPLCPAQELDQCRAAGWVTTECPCLSGLSPYMFGGTRVLTHDGTAADVTIDVPPGLWTSVNLLTEGEPAIGEPGCAPGEGACCDATVDGSVGTYELDSSIGDETTRAPWRNLGQINFPGPPAPAGAGYALAATSERCEAITATEDPEDFAGKGHGAEQEIHERGNLTVCAGCLRAQTCADLVP